MFYKFTLFILIITIVNSNLLAQKSDIINKLDNKDSLESKKAEKMYSKTLVTREVHNAIFRNIYREKNENEEKEFQIQLEKYLPFEGMKIDTIIFRKFEILGQNIYDTLSQGNKLEHFVSSRLHINTKTKVLVNRYMLFKHGDVFHSYKIMENARLIRTSGIVHDVRFIPQLIDGTNNKIILYVYIQDVFPYSFSFSPRSISNADFGINNVNIGGLGHQIGLNFKFNQANNDMPFGYGVNYTIPNILKKQFVNFNTQYQHFSNFESFQMNISRQFSRPEFLWAGGIQSNIINSIIPTLDTNSIKQKSIINQAWYSRAIPFRNKNYTVNALILGMKFSKTDFLDRPSVNSTTNFAFWNSNFLLGSAGYSLFKYRQDRLLNGFGRTEDIPSGFSFNLLYGNSFTEFGTKIYYGAQLLTQHYNKSGAYFNFSVKSGAYSFLNLPNQGVLDFNLQSASPVFKMGNFRWRNYFNSRLTTGINMDRSQFITYNDYNGIRGLNNGTIRGNLRTTMSFQSNLFLPMSFLGFRYSVFGLIELAKMNQVEQSYFGTPLNTGFSMGVSFKNENLIFDVIQLQYGYYPSTNSLTTHQFLISSIIPFSFQSLDISKPNVVEFK